MADATENTATIDGTEVRYAYSSSTGIIFVEIGQSIDPHQALKCLSSKLMFNYAWLVGDQVSIYRAFGDRRWVTLEEPDVSKSGDRDTVLLSLLATNAISGLFDNEADCRQLGARIWSIALDCAQSMDSSRTLKDRLIEVMNVLNDVLVALLSRRPNEPGCDSNKEPDGRGVNGSLTRELERRLKLLPWTDPSSEEQTGGIMPSLLNWVYENITCSLLNAPDDSGLTMLQPRGLKRNNRRTGSYYTPDHITRYMAGNSLTHWLKIRTNLDLTEPEQLSTSTEEQRENALTLLQNVKILDPAVGGGVFLLAAAEWLENARLLLGDRSPSHEIRANIINTNLYGVDIMAGAVELCKTRLGLWYLSSLPDSLEPQQLGVNETVRRGNSLIGAPVLEPPKEEGRTRSSRRRKASTDSQRESHMLEPSIESDSFDWDSEFAGIMANGVGGFDIIIGNPPYGSILSASQRRAISDMYGGLVSGGEDGTWNTAAFFIVRSRMLLNKGGEMGFIVPNSVLRVHQFSKTRSFLLEHMKMWEIADEGSPFQDVTLEMVSIFCCAEDDTGNHSIRVVSRRPGLEGMNSVQWEVLRSGRIFVLYYDDILAQILQRSVRDFMNASRGKDIPKAHVNRQSEGVYTVPYATKGRSVKRYGIDSEHLLHTDEWFRQDDVLMDSYSRRFLLATKNYPYPRCVMKPKGMIHGGGAVRIQPIDEGINLEALGAILNSRIVRYVCTRYLTNYSQLTTCMNTGIFEDMPIVYPRDDKPLALLFRGLSELHSRERLSSDQVKATACLERVTDAITYSLYLGGERDLVQTMKDALNGGRRLRNAEDLYKALDRADVERSVRKVLENPTVKRIESSPFMSAQKSTRRH